MKEEKIQELMKAMEDDLVFHETEGEYNIENQEELLSQLKSTVRFFLKNEVKK